MESSKHDWTKTKIICDRISIQTLLFQACLPTRKKCVKNRDKAIFKIFVKKLTIWQAVEMLQTTSSVMFLRDRHITN